MGYADGKIVGISSREEAYFYIALEISTTPHIYADAHAT
jgi:hypothetical protein